MPVSRKRITILVALLATGGLFATHAAAEERCTGTLCDLYYGGPPAPEAPGAKPAGSTPLTVPKGGVFGLFGNGQPAAPGAPAAAPSRVQVEGGGIAGMMRGAPAERCSGTLCDLYYGGPPPEKPEAPPSSAASAEPQTAAAAPDEGADAEPAIRYREVPERREPPRCAAAGRDPWSCYR